MLRTEQFYATVKLSNEFAPQSAYFGNFDDALRFMIETSKNPYDYAAITDLHKDKTICSLRTFK